MLPLTNILYKNQTTKLFNPVNEQIMEQILVLHKERTDFEQCICFGYKCVINKILSSNGPRVHTFQKDEQRPTPSVIMPSFGKSICLNQKIMLKKN